MIVKDRKFLLLHTVTNIISVCRLLCSSVSAKLKNSKKMTGKSTTRVRAMICLSILVKIYAGTISSVTYTCQLNCI